MALCAKCSTPCARNVPLYICNNRHVYCENCFLHYVYQAHGGPSRCPQCGSHFSSQNTSTPTHHNPHLPPFRPCTVSPSRNRSINTLCRPTISTMSTMSSSLLSPGSSRRPVRCPTGDCGKVIAVTSLALHFAFEHPRTEHKSMVVDRQANVMLKVDALGKSAQCVMLLLVSSGEPSGAKGGDLPLPLLAAKVNLSIDAGNHEDDVVLVWISGNVEGDEIRCLLQAGDPRRRSLFSYLGPVNSLRSDNTPGKILQRAHCLLLQSAAIAHMTDGGTQPAQLTLQIYGRNS